MRDKDDRPSKPFTPSTIMATLSPLDQPFGCLDEHTLQGLRGLRRPGRPDIYVRILTQYLDSSRQYMDTLRQEIASQNGPELFKVAHSLKSSSGMVGARSLADGLKQLEAIGKSGDVSSAMAIFDRVEAEYRRVRQAIESLLAKEAT